MFSFATAALTFFPASLDFFPKRAGEATNGFAAALSVLGLVCMAHAASAADPAMNADCAVATKAPCTCACACD